MTEEEKDPGAQEPKEEALREAERILRGPQPDAAKAAYLMDTLVKLGADIRKIHSDSFSVVVSSLDNALRALKVMRDSIRQMETCSQLFMEALALKLAMDKEPPEQL